MPYSSEEGNEERTPRYPTRHRPLLICFCGMETREWWCLNPVCEEYGLHVVTGEKMIFDEDDLDDLIQSM